MELLIRDHLRRTNWWITAPLVAVVAGFWFFPGEELKIAQMAFTFSMGMAFALGPQARLWVIPRAIWYLPVARRDVWRAGWLVTTVGITGLLLIAKLPGLLFSPAREAIGMSGLMLSTASDVAAAGAGCMLVILATMPTPSRGLLNALCAAVRATATVLLPSGMLIVLYAPQWFGIGPPLHWSALSGPGNAALACGVAIAIATYFHVPEPIVPTNRLPKTRRPPLRRPLSGVTGLPRLLIHEYAWTLMIAGSFGAGVFAVIYVMSGRITLAEMLENDAVGLLAGYIGIVAALVARFTGMLRHLRVLPLGSTWLMALLVAWPAFVCVTLWVALAIVRYAALDAQPSSHSVATLTAMVGISALVQGIAIRLAGAMKAAVIGSLMIAVPLVQLIAPLSTSSLAWVGLIAFIAAAALDRSALSHATTYRAGANLFVPAPVER